MSLFGKILAMLNVFGAIALFVFALLDYSARQTWSYAVMRSEMELRGIPLDDNDGDAQGRPLKKRLSQTTIDDVFKNAGGDGSYTQVEEVTRLRDSLLGTLAAMKISTPEGEKPLVRERTYLLARYLLPTSDTYLEREEYLAARYYFATEARHDALKARYHLAFDEAVARVNDEVKAGPKLTFEEALFVAMRAHYGEPSDLFTTTFLDQLPRDPAQLKTARFDKAFEKAEEAQMASFEARLKEKFDRALLGPNGPAGSKGQSTDMQRRAIARLLFELAQPVAEDAAIKAKDQKLGEAKEKDPDRSSVAYADVLGETEAYKTAVRRVYAVCGLRMTLAVISDEAALVRDQAAEARRAQERDLATFVSDHEALVEELQDRSELVKAELARLRDSEEKLTKQEILVKQRKAKVDELEKQLAAERDLTQKEADKLSEVSDTVLQLRLEVRDAIKKTEEAEKEIRHLE